MKKVTFANFISAILAMMLVMAITQTVQIKMLSEQVERQKEYAASVEAERQEILEAAGYFH